MTTNDACPTCSGPIRETVGMVCQTCGTDYGSNPDAPPPSGDVIERVAFQAARVLVTRPCAAGHEVTSCDVCMRVPRDVAKVIGDAGLLATPDMLAWKQRFGDLQEEHRKCIESWERTRERLTRERDEAREALRATPVQQDADLERGRQLASERDDLIAAGVNPAELAVPLAPRVFVDGREVVGEMAVTEAQEWLAIPIPPDAEAIGRVAQGLHGYLTPHPELGTDGPGPLGVCSECERIARAALRALSGEVGTDG